MGLAGMLWFDLVCMVHFFDLYYRVNHEPTFFGTVALTCSNSWDWCALVWFGLYGSLT